MAPLPWFLVEEPARGSNQKRESQDGACIRVNLWAPKKVVAVTKIGGARA